MSRATSGTGNDARSDFALRFWRNRNAVAGAVIVLMVLVMAVFADGLAPYDISAVDLFRTWEPPSGEHWLGTDALGRDILSRLFFGARTSLLVALTVLAVTLAIGVMVGMIAGYQGGLLDAILMRIVDVIFAFPEIIFAILIAAVLGPGVLSVIVALSLVWWPGIARLTRSMVLSLRTELYVDAAIASGTRPLKIMTRHLLPNLIAPIIVRASIGVGFIIMAEATLGFLGIGVQEPVATWGAMIRDGLPMLRSAPYLALCTSAALGLTVIGFNLLGDGLRDILDPKIRDR